MKFIKFPKRSNYLKTAVYEIIAACFYNDPSTSFQYFEAINYTKPLFNEWIKHIPNYYIEVK